MLQVSPKLAKKRNLAIESFRNGDLDKAREIFEWLVKKAPGDWEAWNMLGALYGMQGDYVRCETCCLKVLEVQPASFSTYNNLGNALKHQHRMEEAEAAYKKAVDIQPQYAEAYSNLGEMLREKGEVVRAEALLRKAIEIKPDHAGAYNNLGTLCLGRGELQAAFDYYNKSFQLNPSNYESLYNLGCAAMSLGRHDNAADYFRKYLAVQPENSEAWMSLCMVLGQKKNFQEAVNCGKRAVSLSVDSPDAYFVLASTYQAMGENESARIEFEKVMAIDPNHPGARYFKAMLEGETPDHAPHEYVKDLFDAYAHKFENDLVKNLDYRTPEHIARHLKRCIEPGVGIRIIDLGCGTGLMGPLLKDVAAQLVGVDLSPKMVEMARAKGVYDELLVDDVIGPLEKSPGGFDAVIAADVFVYIGRLDDVFSAVSESLAPGGCFVFSTELETRGSEYVLRESGRYAHADEYIRKLSRDNGFEVQCGESVPLRKEGGAIIQGSIHVLVKRV